jgi:peptide/nickel transport system substrate-binding protein
MSNKEDVMSQDEPAPQEENLSRRKFLQRAATVAVAAPGIPAFVGSAAAQAATGRRVSRRAGGVLRVGTSDNFSTFSPWKDDFGNYPFFNNLYGQPLRDVNQADASKALPWLATSLDIAPNAKSVTVKLRPGVTFHHGDPLDADALIANWEAISDPKRSDYAGNWVPFFGGTKKINSTTAQLHFTKPTAPELVRELHARMSLVSPSLLKQGDKALLTQADGTGAFKLTSYKQGVSAILDRNPSFWMKPLPYVDRLEFHYFSDPNAMVSALQSGQLDIALNIPPQDVKNLQHQFTIYSGPGSICNCILANCNPGHPFASIDARHALQHLVNRKRYNEQALFGTGSPTYTFAPSTSIAWEPKFAHPYPYDPALAKSLFEKLGMLNSSTPIQVLQLTGIIPAIGQNAEILAEEMNKIGLKAELVPADIATWVSKFKGDQAGSFDLMTSSDGTVNRYPILQTAGNTGSKVASNPLWKGGVPPADYRNAILQATFARTAADQKKWSQRFEEIQLNESFDIAVAYQHTQYAMKHNVTGFGDGRDDWVILDHVKLA